MRILLASLLVVITATAHAAEPVPDVSTLMRGLRHKDATQRLHAAAAIGDLGVKAKAALPALVKALDDPHRLVRFYAAEAIGKIGGRLTSELKARLMKAVKTDESWIVARQAALALERLDPKGLWAHAILLQRPGESSAPIVVKSMPNPPVSAGTIIYAFGLLRHSDTHVVLSALTCLDAQHEGLTSSTGVLFAPLMYHREKRIRTLARRIVARLGDDGERAALLADLSTDALDQNRFEEVLRQVKRTGDLTGRTIRHIESHPSDVSLSTYAATLLAFYRDPANRFLPARIRVPFQVVRTDGDVFLEFATTNESRKFWLEQLRTRDHKRLIGALSAFSMPKVRAPSLGGELRTELVKLVGDSRAGVSESAIRALSHIRSDWQSIAKPVRKLLVSKDVSQRRRVVHFLLTVKTLRAGALPELRNAVAREPAADLRKRIVRGFYAVKADDAATIATLAKVVANDRDAEVRSLAASTIADFGRNANVAIKPLFAALQLEKNTAVKLQIALALDRCLKPQSPARDVVRKLVVEYSRQVAMATLREIIRKQDELAKETRRRNVLSVLGPPSQP